VNGPNNRAALDAAVAFCLHVGIICAAPVSAGVRPRCSQVMFRVIDTILLDQKVVGEGGLGWGLYVILDLARGTSPAIECDAGVRVHRPDGSSFEAVVNGVEVWGPNVGLFFRGKETHDIPVLSEIEFVAA